MKVLANHIVLMVLYSVLTGAFFALLWKEGRRDRWKVFAQVAGTLFFGGLLLAWIMYPFPLR